MQTGEGLLAVWMQPPSQFEAEFNGWYDNEHIAERMALPGFLGARRYVNLRQGPKYIAIYDLDSVAALTSAAYQKVRTNPTPLTRKVGAFVTTNIRNEYEQLKSIGPNPIEPAPYLYMVQLETDAEHDAELNDWYNSEHLAALAGVPGCSGARRYRSSHATPKYLAVYELASSDITNSPAWRTAADTPWSLKLRPHFRDLTSTMGQLIKTVP